MGVSFNIIPIAKIQNDKAYIEHIDKIDKYGSLDYSASDENSRYPTLNEVYDTLNRADINVKSENKSLDEFELKKGNRIIIHSLTISDSKNVREDDLTVRYEEAQDPRTLISSMFGIKSDIRILIRFTISLTKICGPYIISSPYEVCLIDKLVGYDDFIENIRGKLFHDD